MANYCKNCGSALNEGIAFCPNCGTPINQVNNNNSNIQTNNINVNTTPNMENNQNITHQPVQSTNQPISDMNQQYNTQMKIQNQSKSTNDNTVTAFVLSLLGFLCCTYLAIPGLIMSILSLQKINNGSISNKHKGLAIAGIILGAIGIIVMINNIVNPNPEVTEMVNEIIGG